MAGVYQTGDNLGNRTFLVEAPYNYTSLEEYVTNTTLSADGILSLVRPCHPTAFPLPVCVVLSSSHTLFVVHTSDRDSRRPPLQESRPWVDHGQELRRQPVRERSPRSVR